MKKTVYTLLLASCLLLGLTSCSEDVTESNVTLQFKLTYGDDPLYGFQDVDYPSGYKVFFSKYSMFLSNITLTSTEGDVTLSEVEWIDLLTDINDVSAARSGVTRSYASVPARQYNGITFNIGVPTNVNATAPADYPSSNPLSNTGEYWAGWSSYIFHKIEGKMDTDNDGVPETGIALHIGSDQAYRKVSINANINIDQETETIEIDFDLLKNLELSSGYFDFVATPQVHHLGVLAKVLPILDSTAEKITVR